MGCNFKKTLRKPNEKLTGNKSNGTLYGLRIKDTPRQQISHADVLSRLDFDNGQGSGRVCFA